MRALITGGTGFVGHYLVTHLEERGDEVVVLPLEIDISETDKIASLVDKFSPEVIYHLAALTHVGRSWEEPAQTFEVNALGTLGLLEVARQAAVVPRVLLVSSAEVYGGGGGRPLDEQAPLRPTTPYASSKVAAEFIGLQAFLGRGLQVVRARPFNHVGPGQSATFVVSGLAKRIAQAERDGTKEIRVGNLSAARDFTDVRDVVRAYRLLAERGIAGEVYNVCSGEAISISALLDELVAQSPVPIAAVVDQDLFRPVDVPVVVGDCSALVALTGWRPSFSRSTTLSDVLAEWRRRLAQADPS